MCDILTIALNSFFHKVLKSPHNPIHQVGYYFVTIEFASRGSIHIHCFAYLKDATQYGEASNDKIAACYDKIISCSSDVNAEHHQYLEYKVHQHLSKHAE